MIPWLIFIAGCACGWLARSIQFGADRECANPAHNEPETIDLVACPWCEPEKKAVSYHLCEECDQEARAAVQRRFREGSD